MGNYLFMGLAFAMFLSLKVEYRDGFYQIMVVGVFFILTGIKDNFTKLNVANYFIVHQLDFIDL